MESVAKPWIDVVTNPLGLAGFALFLVFWFLSRRAKQQSYKWLPFVAVVMACFALIGGLLLASKALHSNTTEITTSSGDCGAIVSGVGGSVHIDCVSPAGQASQAASTSPEASGPGVVKRATGKGGSIVTDVKGDVILKSR